MRLASDRADLTLSDCSFYHTCQLRDGRVIDGPWDHRGLEAEYLGGMNLSERRVLELGPATGYFSFYLERCGAEVVSFEVGFDRCIDLLPPVGGVVDTSMQASVMARLETVNNSWWYLHRDTASNAKMVYGNIYLMPLDMGIFDVSFFGSILLHLRDPFAALEQAAMRTSDAIVVTDGLYADLMPPTKLAKFESKIRRRLHPPVGRLGAGDPTNLLRFGFDTDNQYVTSNWWNFSPGAIANMLRRLGFGEQSMTHHRQRYHVDQEVSQPLVDVAMFTVVGRRTSGRPTCEPGPNPSDTRETAKP